MPLTQRTNDPARRRGRWVRRGDRGVISKVWTTIKSVLLRPKMGAGWMAFAALAVGCAVAALLPPSPQPPIDLTRLKPVHQWKQGDPLFARHDGNPEGSIEKIGTYQGSPAFLVRYENGREGWKPFGAAEKIWRVER